MPHSNYFISFYTPHYKGFYELYTNTRHVKTFVSRNKCGILNIKARDYNENKTVTLYRNENL